MLSPTEWPLLTIHVRQRPWRVFTYGAELLALIFRRFWQRVYTKLQKDVHRGIKRRPKWLQPLVDEYEKIGILSFPSFHINGFMPNVPLPALRPEDNEGRLMRHRWSGCVTALGCEVRARVAFDDALIWIAKPPVKSDIAWESYSCCERVVNLALLLAAHPSLVTESNRAQIWFFFKDSAEWIDAHLEYYGPVRTNNHFLNNGRALVVAGAVIGNNALFLTGLHIVKRFAPELFPVDGCLREGSLHYQFIVVGWIFDVLAFASMRASTSELERLEYLANECGRACARLILNFPDTIQHIGDISPDMHPRSTLARLKLLYGSRLADCTANATMGEWVLVERDRSVLLSRAVRSWPSRYTTHAHEDLCSFIWSIDGNSVLVDSGRQDYRVCLETEAQVGPTGHNTLLINGRGALASSVLRVGLWYPQPYSNAEVEVFILTDGFSLRHSGFLRIPGVGQHSRKVSLATSGLHVVDRVEGVGEFEVAIYWHFSPEWSNETETLLVSNFGRLKVAVNSSESVRWRWCDYDFSEAYGEVRRARCLVLEGKIELPASICIEMGFTPCVE